MIFGSSWRKLMVRSGYIFGLYVYMTYIDVYIKKNIYIYI